MYFTAETQEAIEQYQDSEDLEENEKLYNEKIRPAFDKLVENLIFVYGFQNANVPVFHLKNDCISFLYETIQKWDPERGTKAFSYFNVVAKNWLIADAKKRKKRKTRQVYIDDAENLNQKDKNAIANSQVAPSPDDLMDDIESRQEIIRMLYEIEKKITAPNELICVNAIKTVFENVDDLDYLNKRALFVYVREISGLNQKQLSIALASIRRHYRDFKKLGIYEIF
jgi:hypothetical protein